MEITGKIIAVLEKKSGISQKTNNSWATQEYVIETQETYPKKMCFEVFGEDKIASFNIKTGDLLRVLFDVDARQYQDRWYNSIRAWKVEGGRKEVVKESSDSVPADAPQTAVDNGGTDTSDLPF